ncbi:TRAP transporter large permease subunit [Desulfovibrio sp. OttesenSCG-928-C06]|nr:TRAP transporter large permease subunit [Desulfovibrio sp. OttesenSCG-928-C06]
MSHDPNATSVSAEVCLLDGKILKCISKGILPPLSGIEHAFNQFSKIMIYISAILTGLLTLPICIDIIARAFGAHIPGVIEIQTYSLVPIAFFATGFLTVSRQHIQIDIFFDMFSYKRRSRLILLANLIGFTISAVMTWLTFEAGLETSELSPDLYLPQSYFIWITSFGFATAGIGFFFQILHALDDLIAVKDWFGIIYPLVIVVGLACLPFIYKAAGYKMSGLVIGSIGFVILFSLLLVRVPIAFAMAFIGLLGLICLKRTTWAALSSVGDIPFIEVANFVFVAIPMFMFMGELAFYSGISADLFECANRWLGRLPGGLACATVGGCAGFGAVCGESLPTVITMSAVALPPMRDRNYDVGLATGALAAGGTLGILIPPSIGFIFYSIITEASVGRLFIAGIVPGLLLAAFFIVTIMLQVKRNPSLAPKGDIYTMGEKLASLILLLPMVLIFVLVVGGILAGWFTPGEGGAVGAVGVIIYSLLRIGLGRALAGMFPTASGTLGSFIAALLRNNMSAMAIKNALMATVTMSGKIFMIFAGVYCFGAFLGSSRLPELLAETVATMDVNRYVILGIVVLLYIALGCVMNILPMMLLTLPSIFPTIKELGFDEIWFGVITVMLMEMGLITPPVGMNVFTLASLAPDIPMAKIFRGVMPFFIAMLLAAVTVIIFPQLALWLPDLLMPVPTLPGS